MLLVLLLFVCCIYFYFSDHFITTYNRKHSFEKCFKLAQFFEHLCVASGFSRDYLCAESEALGTSRIETSLVIFICWIEPQYVFISAKLKADP